MGEAVSTRNKKLSKNKESATAAPAHRPAVAVKSRAKAKAPVAPSARPVAHKPASRHPARPGTKATQIAPAAPVNAAAGDDVRVIALSLPETKPNQSMAAYFKKCMEKLGFVPNVLKAYAFDMAKLEAFVAMYNDLMLGPSGLSKLEREMVAVAVSSQNRCYYCLVAHGAAVRQLSNDPVLGELMVMNYRAARLSQRQRAMLDFAVKLTSQPWTVEEADRERLRRAGFSDRDIWDIAAIAGFFNMSNRVASAADMRPNTAYHKQAR
jgi:uncharacterized peroxidase-related enzyme